MAHEFNQLGALCLFDQPASRTLGSGLHDFNHQCLRILRCTAKAMASSPGGLRFQAGTRPWLEGLAGGRRVAAGLPVVGE